MRWPLALRRLVHSPFDHSLGCFDTAQRALLAPPASRLVERSRTEPSERVLEALLARGHAEVCTRLENHRHPLAEPVWQPLWDRAGVDRAAVIAVLSAAGRCYRALSAIVGRSEAMARARRETWAACFGQSLLQGLTRERIVRDHDVLILGETGTGKEAIAQAIAEGCQSPSNAKRAPYAAVNAAAVPDTLIESELFGHVRGAFTGASETRRGRIRAAHGGTFFLDEVGDLPPPTQVKLLRVMETNEVNPLGADRGEPADVRYIAATHKPLLEMIRTGSFRRDLYERLAGVVIRLPPLRERPEDIEDIGMAFVERTLGPTLAAPERRSIERWLSSREARDHSWPGNVRELYNALRSVLLGLEPELGATEPQPSRELPKDVDLPEVIRRNAATLDEATRWYVGRVFAENDQNYSATGRVLGIDRATVRRHLER